MSSKYTVYTGPARPHICTCIPRATIIDLIYIFQCFNSADSIIQYICVLLLNAKTITIILFSHMNNRKSFI